MKKDTREKAVFLLADWTGEETENASAIQWALVQVFACKVCLLNI